MDHQEFLKVTRLRYDLQQDASKSSSKYNLPPGKSVRMQMAIMYELLGQKDPIDFEEEERQKVIDECIKFQEEKRRRELAKRSGMDGSFGHKGGKGPQHHTSDEGSKAGAMSGKRDIRHLPHLGVELDSQSALKSSM